MKNKGGNHISDLEFHNELYLFKLERDSPESKKTRTIYKCWLRENGNVTGGDGVLEPCHCHSLTAKNLIFAQKNSKM